MTSRRDAVRYETIGGWRIEFARMSVAILGVLVPEALSPKVDSPRQQPPKLFPIDVRGNLKSGLALE